MKLNNPFPSSSLNTICIQPVNLRIFVQITIVQFTVLLVPASVGAYRRVASIGPSPQVFVSSLLSTDLSSSSAYCSSRARAFPPSPVTSWSTWSPSQREAGWGRESSSALTVRRVSDRMLLISCWSSLGCCPDCSTWLRWMFALERHTGSLCQKCLRSIDVFVSLVYFDIWLTDYDLDFPVPTSQTWGFFSISVLILMWITRLWTLSWTN